MKNGFKTAALLGLLSGLLLVVGDLWAGQRGLVLAFVFIVPMNLISYFFSDKIVLAMYRAKEIPHSEAPRLHRIVQELADEAHVPKPRVCFIPQPQPNAFATGRNPKHAVVAVTAGLLDLLDERELKGVLAHEMAHVLNRDILIGAVAAMIAATIAFLARMAQWAAIFGGHRGSDRDEGGGLIGLIAMAVFAPLAAMLIQMAISRSREFQADATGAKLCRDPDSLASALEKLHYGSQRVGMDASPATAHMFIVSPLSGPRRRGGFGGMAKLFSTHPPVEERVARLRAMAF